MTYAACALMDPAASLYFIVAAASAGLHLVVANVTAPPYSIAAQLPLPTAWFPSNFHLA